MVIVPKGPHASRARDMARVQGDWGKPPLPAWVKRIYDYQHQAVEQVVEEFERGADVVMLDAPTGSGKTLIGELVRRKMQVERGLYVCTTKMLQHQVIEDFKYARVLKGRTNYTPTKVTTREASGYRQGYKGMDATGITCADCDAAPSDAPLEEQSCSYCEYVEECPYKVARDEALVAPVGVLNTSYLLAECNGPGKFKGRELVIADEADLLERELLGYVELRLGKRIVELLGVEVPKKGSHMTTIRKWLEDEVTDGLVDLRKRLRDGRTLEQRREHARIDRLLGEVRRVVDREEGWVREGDEERYDALVLKPVSVEDVAGRYLWAHGEKWLLMSGTTVSAAGQADALGIETAELEWAEVRVDSQFARENRRVVFAPVGNMTRKGQEAGGVVRVVRGVERVLELWPEVNVLIHTHTYKLAKEMTIEVRKMTGVLGGRRVLTYEGAGERDQALEQFKKTTRSGGAVLIASSMDRGVDLPGDLCRVQIVCKVPHASLGSRQVSERMRMPGGQMWYTMGTVRSVMQMCGRAVRGRDDWAVTYVLDEDFGKLLKSGKQMGMWPQWWLDGLEVGRVREFI